MIVIAFVLHSYKLTRFSNCTGFTFISVLVLHSYKLTRFSNEWFGAVQEYKFYTLTNLQGSQTQSAALWQRLQFYTLTNLQGSQTTAGNLLSTAGFTLLQTYKVLKL